ncbi:MAG: DUF1553 domain-containing protein [Planctomycetota bacterium]|nr:DUF1553 domain-containing protein [Planctomycetota bacterium]
MNRPLLFCSIFSGFLLGAASAQAVEPLLFNRDIRPILSDKCFACHGNDPNKRTADMRLDVRESAITARGIVPGRPDESEALTRMMSDDPDVQMPPPGSKLSRLSPHEIAIIRQWIAEGAAYQDHWSFVPLQPIRPNHDRAPTEIDAFVWKGLATRGLVPQPEADKSTLLRRVSFDLTGLPPSPAEAQAFLADNSPDAYGRVVDRLLQSVGFGERMAVDWLDIARYADSYGFQVDRDRDVSLWRDWVIKAFNTNLPFDQFVHWQLAGDLLPNPTDEQIVATAFNRLHQQESEGGSVEEEYRVEYVCDRVQTFSTAFLGLTFECARCHDHKYDPLTQRDYYQLFAMFQNIDESGLYSYAPPTIPTPTLSIVDVPTKARIELLQRKTKDLEMRWHTSKEESHEAFSHWLNDRPTEIKIDNELARYGFETIEGNKLANDVAADKPAVLGGDAKFVAGIAGQAIEFTGDDGLILPLGKFARHEPFSVSLWLKTPRELERAVVLHCTRGWTDSGSQGYELLIIDGHLRWSLNHFWPGNAISIEASQPLPVAEWTHVVVSSDGSSRADGLRLTVNGRPAEVSVLKDHLTKQITGEGGDQLTIGQRSRDRGFPGGQVDELRVFGRALSPLESLATFHGEAATRLLQLPSEQLTPADRAMLFEHFVTTVDEDQRQQLTAISAARVEQNQLMDSVRELMVMRELPQPKQAFVLRRGEYNGRGEEVFSSVPAAFLPLPDNAPSNRLGLAQWLTDRKHPLTARVTVNRLWQGLFGVGLVKTAEDFGSQGTPPLYPELLDWLALRFIDSGWDTKAILRTIVMSHTYRQRSVADAEIMADDPENLWLARGPRFRLSAEMIRDNALLSAGLLHPQVGGAPVFPYEMSESFKPTSPSSGSGLYRRSIYTHWRRTGPPPALVAFDAPRRAVCTARRERTDSPLQPLILLNGIQYVEAARVLGESLYVEAKGDVTAMIERGFVQCLSRKPDTREFEILKRLYNEQCDYFTEHASEANALLHVGATAHQSSVPIPHAAAACVLAQSLLNHDESVVKR